ncbi:Uncharacterised protein [Kluyvera cryocrescens]|uniref:Uncharacterized protein n=1 Tax=Kluyvera cryocrescens TaxID=580 RepID=A0A485ABG3_KLUCR|nr:Uncharacterised protein [Kluyvera cryocrescens]
MRERLALRHVVTVEIAAINGAIQKIGLLLIDAIPSPLRRPALSAHLNTKPERYQAKVGGVLNMESLSLSTV